jgi:3-deoxy-D-manno-octulosonic-acid transferase
MRASRLRYWLLLNLLGLPLLLLFIWQGWRGGVLRYPRERLGFVPPWPANQNHPIWFHAASVGEVNAVIPLLQRIAAAHPQQPILLTTTTISGFHNARRQIPGINHHFLPFDFRHSVQRFIRHIQPKALFIVETEIWPTLFQECDQQGVAIAIINGRLSQKTLTAPPWVQQLYRTAVARVAQIATRSEDERLAFIALGAAPERCHSLGNIKYASTTGHTNTPIAAEINGLARPIVVAASTRDGEEQIIAASWQTAGLHDQMLVIVPRHPERLLDILKDLASYHVAIRSRDEAVTAKTEIYLADTFGELNQFIAASELVIMGGSFVDTGGQNLLEPAAASRAIIVGPYMDNFAEETRELLSQQAIIQVADGEELSQQLIRLLKEPLLRKEMGERAAQFIKSHADLLEHYLHFVEQLIIKPANQRDNRSTAPASHPR